MSKEENRKNFSKYVSQNILGMIGFSCYVLADSYFISIAKGADGLTALNLVMPLYSIIFSIGEMIGVVTLHLSALAARTEHERTGLSLRNTVHKPQLDVSQPHFTL